MAKKGKFLDFDQFWSEMRPDEAEAPRVRVFGEEVTLPASPPAMIVLRYLRAGVDPDAKVEPDFMVKLAEAIFGRERLDGWLEKGLTLFQLIDLVTRTVRMYTGGDDEYQGSNGEDAEGNAQPAQVAGGAKSSKTGD